MAILNNDDVVMLIIDVQEKLVNAVYNKELIINKSTILSKTASILQIPTFVTEQYPKGLGSTIDEVKQNLSSNVKYFEKQDFNALSNELLIENLLKLNRKQVVIFGIETHICVHQTANALIEKGYEVFFVSDASSSRAIEEHHAGIVRMKENGVYITTTEIALFELLKTAKNPHFKDLQSLIK